MKFLNLKSLAVTGVLGGALLFAGSVDTSAQTYRDWEREQQRIQRQQQREYNRRIRAQRQRQNQRDRDYRRNDRYTDRDYRRDNGYNDPYVTSGGASYDWGYQNGLAAGQRDRGKKYGRSNVYRNTGSSPNMGDPSSTDYIYRQGFLRGYDDGFYGRRNY